MHVNEMQGKYFLYDLKVIPKIGNDTLNVDQGLRQHLSSGGVGFCRKYSTIH